MLVFEYKVRMESGGRLGSKRRRPLVGYGPIRREIEFPTAGPTIGVPQRFFRIQNLIRPLQHGLAGITHLEVSPARRNIELK